MNHGAPADGAPPLGWGGIVRLGLVQAMLGAVVVLVTVTMNRVMLVELHLPAALPAFLVALQYFVQVIRPAMGHGSDRGGRRAPWIRGGVLLMAGSALLAAESLALIGAGSRGAGIALAVLAYALIGIGVGMAGTALLALLGHAVAPSRRASAAAVVWMMMIAGIAVCAGLAGHALTPFSLHQLFVVTGVVGGLAVAIAILATAGIERRSGIPAAIRNGSALSPTLAAALAQAWRDPAARRFTLFVALSMLAYSAEEILLEPFAGFVFSWPPGSTAQLTGQQHGGALAGMLLVALLSPWRWSPPVRHWVLGGCVLSAAALLALAACALSGQSALLSPLVLLLGLGNGVFAVAAIGAMMQMAGRRGGGVRIGLWGAAQALAMGAGDLGAGIAMQAAMRFLSAPSSAFAILLGLEAVLFGTAAWQSVRVFGGGAFAPAVREAVG
ncbi:MFS transporter [Endosaccharibacter trunci]|uniref:MFS transporter n=1 Tax=Endosaccharibacter trunci TaxID=2812733 RepID=UPI003BF4D7E6